MSQEVRYIVKKKSPCPNCSSYYCTTCNQTGYIEEDVNLEEAVVRLLLLLVQEVHLEYPEINDSGSTYGFKTLSGLEGVLLDKLNLYKRQEQP